MEFVRELTRVLVVVTWYLVFLRMLLLTVRRIRKLRPTKTMTDRMSSRRLWMIRRTRLTDVDEKLERLIMNLNK